MSRRKSAATRTPHRLGTKRFLSRVVSVLALAVCIGCPLIALSQPLTVYSGRGEKFTKPVIEAFTNQTGIEVRLQTGTSGALLAKLQVEGERTPADVFITNSVGVLEARRHCLLAPVTVPALTRIAPEFRAADDSWVAFSARLRVIGYNTDIIQPGIVTSVMDLADPRWQGRVGTVTSGNQSFIWGPQRPLRLARRTGHRDLPARAQGEFRGTCVA